MDRELFNRKTLSKVFGICLAFTVIFFIYAFAVFESDKTPINNEELNEYSQNWIYSLPDEDVKYAISQLPKTVKSTPYEPLLLENTLPEDFNEGDVLFFRSTQVFVKVYQGDELVYTSGQDSIRPFSKSPGSRWHFVRLYNTDEEKVVKVELTSPYNDDAMSIPEFYTGTKSASILHIFKVNSVGLIISVILIFISFIQLALYLVLRNRFKVSQIKYLSLFTFLAGIWSLLETKTLEFFIVDTEVLVILSSSLLILITTSFLFFLCENYKFYVKKYINFMIFLNIYVYAILMILQILNIFDLFELIDIPAIIIVVEIAIFLMILSYETIVKRNKDLYIIGIGGGLLSIFTLLELTLFYINPDLLFAAFFRVGMLLFCLMLLIDIFVSVSKLLKDDGGHDMLNKVINTDIDTNLSSRAKFEADMREYSKNKENLKDLSIAVFDLNNLKIVNSNQGYEAGNQLIKLTAKVISDSFSHLGKVYRIGGDEFAFLSFKVTEDGIPNLLRAFEENILINNSINKLKVSVSYAFIHYDEEIDTSPDDLFLRADDEMTVQKIHKKSGM